MNALKIVWRVANCPAVRTSSFTLVALCLTLISGFCGGSDSTLDNWHWRNPLPQGNDLQAVACGNITFVAVGGSGTILSSADGTVWSRRSSKTINHLLDIVSANGMFVTVGDLGTVLTSPDGVTWTSASSGTTNRLWGVNYCNGTFVAVGDSGTVLFSADGVAWTSRSSGTSRTLYSVTYGNGVYVASGASGTVVTSPDGIAWTSTPLNTSLNLPCVTYGNGTFVAGEGSGSRVQTSPDGVTWTGRLLGTVHGAVGITYGAGTFVGVGAYGTVVTSPDGVAWTSRTSGTINHVVGVTHGNGTFVAVGALGTILTSPDAFTWTTRSSGTTNYLDGVAYGNGTFVVVGGTNFSGPVLTSPDGVAWTSRTSGATNPLFGVTHGNGTFVAVGNGVRTSPDGIAWTSRSSGNSLYGVTYGDSAFVAVGSNGSVRTSPDAVVWTSGSSGITRPLYAVTYGNGMFVAVGDLGTVLTSLDGVAWTSRDSGTASTLRGVIYAEGKFVTVGYPGTVLTSPDGIVWTRRTSGPANLLGVTHGNGTFVAVGYLGTVLSSPDGVVWTSRSSGTYNDLYGSICGNGTFVAVGGYGTILQSENVQASTCSITFYHQPGELLGNVAGHAYVALSDKHGSTVSYGFYAGNFLSTFGGEGVVSYEESTPWDYGISYPISLQQWGMALNAIVKDVSSPPSYNLVTFNCMDWLAKIATAAGVQLPGYQNLTTISDPLTFGNSLGQIGNGNTYSGGTVISNSSAFATAPLFAFTTATPWDFSYSGLESAGHTDPANLATTIGVRYDHVNLGTVTANDVSGISLTLAGIDPGFDLVSIDWGDTSTRQAQSLSFSHVYASGTYSVHLLVINAGAVHSYDMTVVVSTGTASSVAVNVTAFPPADIPNPGLIRANPAPDFFRANIVSFSRLSTEHAFLDLTGIPTVTYTIEATSDLKQGFQPIGTSTADADGFFGFDDPAAVGATARFYRARFP